MLKNWGFFKLEKGLLVTAGAVTSVLNFYSEIYYSLVKYFFPLFGKLISRSLYRLSKLHIFLVTVLSYCVVFLSISFYMLLTGLFNLKIKFFHVPECRSNRFHNRKLFSEWLVLIHVHVQTEVKINWFRVDWIDSPPSMWYSICVLSILEVNGNIPIEMHSVNVLFSHQWFLLCPTHNTVRIPSTFSRFLPHCLFAGTFSYNCMKVLL